MEGNKGEKNVITINKIYLKRKSNLGVIIYSFNLNISPKMSYGVLECDIMLQNYMFMIL